MLSRILTRQHERRTRSDGYWRDFGWSRSSQGHLRGHRDTARRRAGEIRARQGVGGAHGRSLPAHRHVLSGELWLHPADIVGRRRSLRRAGRYAGAGGAGGDRALPAGGRAADGRRGWPRHLLVGWEWRLDHGVVALHFEAVPPQRHVLDLVDAGILAHEIWRRVVARGAILNFIGNDAQVGQAGIRYRERKAGIAEGGEVEFALADGGDLQ